MTEFDFDTKNTENFFVISDIHGKYDQLKQVLSFRKEDETLICLGDIGDRGDKSYECFELIAEQPNRILLYGNHDIAAKWTIKHNSYCAEDIWIGNGGLQFVMSLPSMKNNASLSINDIPKVITDVLDEMVLYHKSGNLIFVHAGVEPEKFSTTDKYFNLYENEETSVNYKKFNVDIHPVWIRSNFLQHGKPLYDYKNNRVLIIHGHTSEPTAPKITEFDVNLDAGFHNNLCAMRIHGNTYEFIVI